MSAISSPSQTLSAGEGNAGPAVSSAEIDASCRGPLTLLFLCAILWLVAASVLGMIATLKFHAPGILADCPWFTYGRVHPAYLNAFVYGFAVQAGLGVILWIVAHLGRTTLALGPAIIGGTLLWNLGMVMGIVGILYGESTGYEWLEMPRYALATLFWGYALVAVGALVTLHQRTQREFYISQWFIIAALFWFPWILSTAMLLLVLRPVRGALQMAIDSWYANNLTTVWFGFIGLATIFYFVPKIIKRPFYSHYNGLFIFWVLVLFGSWAAIPPGSPLPSWMAAMSTMGQLLTVVPALAVGFSVCKTMCGSHSQLTESRPLKFFLFAAIAYVVATLAGAVTSVAHFSKITNFTWFIPAHTELYLYGFFALAMFGAIYEIVPRVLPAEFPAQVMVCGQFVCAGLGILIYAAALGIGGIVQGMALNDPAKAFADVTASSLLFLRVSTLGDLLMAVGHLILLLNFFGLLVRVGRVSATAAWDAGVKPVEVTP